MTPTSAARLGATPPSGDPIKFGNFEVVWVSLGLLFRQDGLNLEIDPEAQDKDAFIIVPDGPVEFALIPAYDGTRAFFQDNGYNYCVFGYDWRRPIQEAADNLQSFLTDVQAAVQNQFGEDPLPKTTVLCHSQGGLVAKLFLHLPNTLGAAIERVITIATPFYGTASQTQRFFQGEDILNILYGAQRVAPVVGALPGPYVLMPMDHATWVARGAALGVPNYPVLDEAGAPADVYDLANMPKYPPWVSGDFVDNARLVRLTMDLDLPDPLLAKFFHLRADTTHTMALFRWGPLPVGYVAGQSTPNFNLDGGAPNGGMVPGDGTVPAFAAALAQNLGRVLTVPTLQLHEDLAENARFLTAVKAVIDAGALPDPATLEGLPDAAYNAAERPKVTSGEVHSFLSDIAAGRGGGGGARGRGGGRRRSALDAARSGAGADAGAPEVKHGSLVVLALAASLCGCGTVLLTSSRDVALYQSDDQRLIVTNTTTDVLTIIGRPAAPPAVVGPGMTTIIPFRVMTIGTLHAPSGGPYWTVGTGGYREAFIELQSPAIVDASSSVLTLHFHSVQGRPVTASFALNLCGPNGGWAKQQVPGSDHHVQVPDPIPAVPQAVCP
jgi:hypothetical protein